MLYAQTAIPVPFYPLDLTFDYSIEDSQQESIRAGCLVDLTFGKRKSWGIVCSISEKTEFKDSEKIKPIKSLKFPLPVFSEKRMCFLKWLSEYYYYPLGGVFESALPSAIRNASSKLLNKEKIKIEKELHPEKEKTLTQEQELAYKNILESGDLLHVLWGITGSGKTEIYLRLIDSCLKNNQSALILVPEISLTPLLRNRFEKRFPGQIATFHSAQKESDLRKNWLDIFHGRKKIALGARSALFAPLENIGFIIIDEEHDSSYKQEERLRYHARDAALKLAEIYKAKLVLGSATPSAETFNLIQSSKAKVHKLKKRAIENAELPEIQIVDLKKGIAEKSFETQPHESESVFSIPEARENLFLSPELDTAIQETLNSKKQAILFLNKRGLGSQVFCRDCGESVSCPSCDVKLTPHFDSLRCHYCNYSTPIPNPCPSCSGKSGFLKVGVGTQALEKLIELHFPAAKVLRLDRDITAKAGELESVISKFGNGEADILIGTQMVAKGHDFPNVTLVGVLLADLGLNIPDFRASERAFQLLLQVSGRAGRANEKGKVVIQCFDKKHPILQRMSHSTSMDDYEDFLKQELLTRKAFNYSPMAPMFLLRLDSLKETKLNQASSSICTALSRAAKGSFQILGPTPAPIYKVRNRFRSHILLKGPDLLPIRKSLDWILSMWSEKKLEKLYETRLHLDVDPQQMM